MVLQRVEATTLRKEISEGKMPKARVLWVVASLAAALEEAHRRNIVHGAIQPKAVLCFPKGRVKLVGFNLRRDTTGDSIRYMSPEQIATGAPPSVASDLYALGLVFYEMLTGHSPFADGSPLEIIRARMEDAPTPFSEALKQDLHPDIGGLVSDLLCKRPEKRPAAWEVLRTIRRLRGEPTEQTPPPAEEPTEYEKPPSFLRRNWHWLVPALVLLVLVGGGIVLYFAGLESPPPRKKPIASQPAYEPARKYNTVNRPFGASEARLVDFDWALAEATRVAKQMAPSAKLAGIHLTNAGPSALDVSSAITATAVFSFETEDGGIEVRLDHQGFVGSDSTAVRRSLAPHCGYKEAAAAASRAGFKFGHFASATLTENGVWFFEGNQLIALVRSTCAEASVQQLNVR